MNQTLRATKEQDMDVHSRIIKANYQECPEVSAAFGGARALLRGPSGVSGLSDTAPSTGRYALGSSIACWDQGAGISGQAWERRGDGRRSASCLRPVIPCERLRFCPWCTLLA